MEQYRKKIDVNVEIFKEQQIQRIIHQTQTKKKTNNSLFGFTLVAGTIILIVFVIFGVKAILSNDPTDPYVDTCHNNPNLEDCNVEDGYAFSNTSIQSKEEIIELLTFYNETLLEQFGSFVEETGWNIRPVRLLNTQDNRYTREDFTEYDNREVDKTAITEEFIVMNHTLEQLKERLMNCLSFVEDEYCEVQHGSEQLMIRSRMEGNKLFIESYEYGSISLGTELYHFIRTELFYFDIIDEQIHTEFVRDYYEKVDDQTLHRYYYDEYNENGINVNIAIEEEEFYYRVYDLNQTIYFELSDSPKRTGYQYIDFDQEIEYRYYQDELDELYYKSIIMYDDYHPVISYTTYLGNGHYEYISYNLLEYTGWDYIVESNGDVALYQSNVEIMTDFEINLQLDGRQSLGTSRDISVQEITQENIMLSMYGLSHDSFEYSKFETALSNLNSGILFGVTKMDFTLDMDQNKATVEGLFPFLANQEVIEVILASFLEDEE